MVVQYHNGSWQKEKATALAMNLLGVLKYSAYGVMIGVPLSGAFYHSVGNVSEISGRSMRVS